MNAILLICQHCDEVCGCTEPETALCRDCLAHNCPELPAPRRHQGYCQTCLASPRRYARVAGWVGLPGPSPAGA